MKRQRFILPATLALLGALAAPMATAQTNGTCDPARQGACAQTQKTTATQKNTATQKATASQKATAGQKTTATQKSTTTQKAASKSATTAPKVGDSAKGGQTFQRASNSRVAAQDSAHEYRVVNSSLVLVNRKSLKIEKVLGPVSQFTQQ
ncbi:hypothetical protein [Paenirhodobacter populi]|uniref:Uncharacterized protein n=1 Tax=Paenirhodobacter populi TaxID=2306993 RepID=A0A443IW49_9RHOB|nr:hypothetical protein [Sinirhodobacter populi]RWR12284.1 hypothetical protein D2T33_09260 [Sinirhodobacter populi]